MGKQLVLLTGEDRRLAALGELGEGLAGRRDPREVLACVRRTAAPVLDHDAACLILTGLPSGATEVVSDPVASGPTPARVDAMTRGQEAAVARVLDRSLLADGTMSGIGAPVRLGTDLVGHLFIYARRPRAFAERDAIFLQLIADRVAGALACRRLALFMEDTASERRRAADLEASEALLRALADVLDIREVFPQVSEIASRVLPHDRLSMTFHDGDGGLVMEAVSNDQGPLAMRATGANPAHLTEGFFKIVDDLTHEDSGLTFEPPDVREQIIAAGYRSVLVVHLSAREQQFGLQFWSRRPGGFTPCHVPIARRIAQHVALAVSHEQLAAAQQQASDARARAEQLEARVRSLSDELEARSGYGRVLGHSDAWRAVLRAATQVASAETTVLLTGESGTGKEVVARLIHRASARAGGPFVAVNCAALPEPLLESELFGYERGAFTGAQQAKPGQIELAAGGVLLLDEIGEMSLSAQAKLLRVLQEREFLRLGGTRPIKADARVVVATNRDLATAMARGDFRDDLYFRLHVFEIRLPPLRERPEDILPLSEAFLEELGRSFARPPSGLTREARRALVAHNWPGNVRELRNVLERAAILCEGGVIAPEHLSLQPHQRPAADASTNIRDMERQLIAQVLGECRGNKSQTATRLGLTRKELYGRLRQYGLS